MKEMQTADRSTRVIPLASKIIELLGAEEDSEVRIAAFDVAKVAVEHQRMQHKKRSVGELTRRTIAAMLEAKP
jgi:hypothetical protein